MPTPKHMSCLAATPPRASPEPPRRRPRAPLRGGAPSSCHDGSQLSTAPRKFAGRSRGGLRRGATSPAGGWTHPDSARYDLDVDRDATIEALRGRLALEKDVVAAWVFGSVARGDDGPTSDVDVAILTRRTGTHTIDDLWLDLRADLTALLRREVDLVVLDDAHGELIHRVLRDGIVLVDADRSARIRFEVAARNRFFDMQPIWREYRRGRPAA